MWLHQGFSTGVSCLRGSVDVSIGLGGGGGAL